MGGDISGNGMGEDFGFWDGFDPSSEFQRRQAATAAEKVKDAKQQQTMPHQLTVAERTERQKANYSQLEDVISVRNPSAWNRGSKLAGSGGGSATPRSDRRERMRRRRRRSEYWRRPRRQWQMRKQMRTVERRMQ